ncbi:MAG: hypothetical protein M3Y37_03605 [Chloroflexota bacterium]|nr:hypothetical protein [Chloroflexota bacterium]
MTVGLSTRLGSAIGDRTQHENKRLAEQIASRRDTEAVAELMLVLQSGTKAQRSDAIKVVGEVSLRNPALLTGYVEDLVQIARTGKGVFAWESMTALASIMEIDPSSGDRAIDVFKSSLTGDSVIARDHAIRGLCALAHGDSYPAVMSLLLDSLQTAPVNQFPTYAERVAVVARDCDRPKLVQILEHRIGDMSNPAKVRRIASLLKRLT